MSENNPVKKASLIVIAIVAILALIVFAAFNFLKSKTNQAAPEQKNEQLPSGANNVDASKSKLAHFFAQPTYTITYGINDPEANIILDILFVKDGENMFTHYIYQDQPEMEQSVMVIIGDTYYTIDHTNKTIYRSQATQEDRFSFFDDESQSDVFTSGQETVAGITYDTEDFGDGSIFYFLNNQLKMIKDQENNSVITIKNFSTTIDRSVFVLPTDYKMTEQERVYINDEEITEADLAALKAQGVDISLDELNFDLDSQTDN